MTNSGIDKKPELVKVLGLLQHNIDSADSQNDRVDEMMELVLSRDRGTAALISLVHGFIRSSKKDVELLSLLSDNEQSSLYAGLVGDQNYTKLFDEHWRTT